MKKQKFNINLSLEHKLYLKKIKIDKVTTIISQIAIFIAIMGIWELLVKIKILDGFFFSSPSRILNSIIELLVGGQLFLHIGVTLYETILGFLIATVLGTLLAILLASFKKLRNILEPYVVILNSLPKIALGPMIIIWVGAGTTAIVTICVLICVIVTTLSMLSAFLNCDEDKILLIKSMGANKFQILTKLIIPNAMPEFISVLKINVGLAWVGSIMGEYLVSKAGLGYLIVYGGHIFNLDLVMASTLVLCVLAGGMFWIIAKIEKKYKK
ncbi:MAG: ABC transporter permease [Clostridia bacterium]